MASIDKDILREACIASRPDVWDENGDPRPGQPPAKVEMVTEEIARALQVLQGSVDQEKVFGDHRPDATPNVIDRAEHNALLVRAESALAESERKRADLINSQRIREVEIEQARAAAETRHRSALVTVTESRDALKRKVEKLTEERDDARAQLAAQAAKPKGPDLPPELQRVIDAIQGKQSGGGRNPLEELLGGNSIEEMLRRFFNGGSGR